MTTVEAGPQRRTDAYRTVFGWEQVVRVFMSRAGEYLSLEDINTGLQQLGFAAMDVDTIPPYIWNAHGKLDTTQIYSIFGRGLYLYGPKVAPGEWVSLPQLQTFQDPRLNLIDQYVQQGTLRKGDEATLVKYFSPDEELVFNAFMTRVTQRPTDRPCPQDIYNSDVMVEVYGDRGFYLPRAGEERAEDYIRYIGKPYANFYCFHIKQLNKKLEDLAMKKPGTPTEHVSGHVPQITIRVASRGTFTGSRYVAIDGEPI